MSDDEPFRRDDDEEQSRHGSGDAQSDGGESPGTGTGRGGSADAGATRRPSPVPGSAASDGTGVRGGGRVRRRLRRLVRYVDDAVPELFFARRTFDRNRLRAGLAALGIVIGVFAIATLGILGSVLQLTASDALGDLGNQVIVSPNEDVGAETLDPRDVQQIRRIGEDATVVPIISGGTVVRRGPDRQTFATVYGMDRPGALFTAGSGELPPRHQRGAIVGSGIAEELGVEVGRTITVEGRDYRVIAVLAEDDSITPIRPDNAVILPESVFVADGYNQVIVNADSGTEAGRIAEQIRSEVNAREERVSVFELSSIIREIDRFFGLLNAFLLAIGSISLLVAGVAILNVMLMSTTERREEIGVLRAVGVQKRDVLRLILTEAALLGLVGGVVGVLLSAGVAVGLWLAIPEVTLPTILAPRNGGYLLLGFGFGVVVSVLSGAYPAWKAANDRPVEALRGQ
jgi:putative ABC transport system permease protein